MVNDGPIWKKVTFKILRRLQQEEQPWQSWIIDSHLNFKFGDGLKSIKSEREAGESKLEAL